jgi:hypothetical protein
VVRASTTGIVGRHCGPRGKRPGRKWGVQKIQANVNVREREGICIVYTYSFE